MSDFERIYTVQKAQQWARVKGELRTMVDVLGAQSSGVRDCPLPYELFEAEAEKFIKHIEDEGLAE